MGSALGRKESGPLCPDWEESISGSESSHSGTRHPLGAARPGSPWAAGHTTSSRSGHGRTQLWGFAVRGGKLQFPNAGGVFRGPGRCGVSDPESWDTGSGAHWWPGQWDPLTHCHPGISRDNRMDSQVQRGEVPGWPHPACRGPGPCPRRDTVNPSV